LSTPPADIRAGYCLYPQSWCQQDF